MGTVKQQSGSPGEGAPQQLFVRQATGLVRGVKPWTAAVINFEPGHPAQVLAVSFFFAFALFPGGNYLLAIAILLPLSIGMSYAFGLLTTMIPRDGGDYMLVSRVIHPAVGVISSFCMTVANLFSNAYFGIGFVTISLGPGLIATGLIGHDHTLVNWGTTIEGSTWWKFGLGSAMMLIPLEASERDVLDCHGRADRRSGDRAVHLPGLVHFRLQLAGPQLRPAWLLPGDLAFS
jgi:hypothetical protein